MNQTIELMLKEHVIDKEALLMRKYNLIGMTREQSLLIIGVISLMKINQKITMNALQSAFNYTKSELEHIFADLMEQGLIKISFTKSGIEFNFKALWERLIKTYLTPAKEADEEEVSAWISRMHDLKLTPSNRRDIAEWIKDNGSARIISIVEGLFQMNLKDVSFKNIKELYNADTSDKKAKFAELEKIVKFDWVSK